jgi:hypothetical protein
LVLDVIDSFEKLDVVAFVHRNRASRLTMMTIASALGLPYRVVAEALSDLMRAGLVRTEPSGDEWSFEPNGSRAATVDALIAQYEQDRVETLRLMNELALERVRAQARHAFAGSFVTPPKKPGDPES